MGIGEWIVIAISAIFIIWFLTGYLFNQQTSKSAYAWMRRGLEKRGLMRQGQWLDPATIGYRLELKDAAGPFKFFDLALVLLRRENLPMLFVQLAQGKSDVLLVKANLKTAPRVETHILKTDDLSTKKAFNLGEKQLVKQLESGFEIYQLGGKEPARAEAAEKLLTQYGDVIQRVSLHGQTPHLLVIGSFREMQKVSLEELYQALAAFCD